jgi:hypothetical protein
VRYEIRFAQCVRNHMTFLTVAERSTVLEAIRKQLAHEPLVETRHRKPLRPSPLAPWELQVGPLRAFYDVGYRTRSAKRWLTWYMFWQLARRSGACSGSPGR